MKKISLFLVVMLVITFMYSAVVLSEEKEETSPLALTEIELLKLQNINLKIQRLQYQQQEFQQQADEQLQELNEQKIQHVKKMEDRLKVKLDDYIITNDGILIKKQSEPE